MLFEAATRRELARSFAATLVVVLTIVMTMMLIRVLGLAARGSAAPQDVLLLLGFTALSHLATVLCLSLFVAIVLCLGRMHRDSEITVWLSSGVHLASFLKPVSRTAAPVVVLVALLVFVAWPWVNRQSLELRQRYEQRSDLTRVAPGSFQTSADGQRVFFVDRDQPEALEARNVFILSRQPDAESVTTARAGRLEQGPDGERRLVLEQGQRADLRISTGERAVARFQNYQLRVQEADTRPITNPPPKATPTTELIAQGTAEADGEIAWRAGILLATVNLALLGVGLSSVHPRRPSNWNLVFALLAFVVYFNLVNLSQASVAAGRWTLPGALAALHGLAFLAGAALLWWRASGYSRLGPRGPGNVSGSTR